MKNTYQIGGCSSNHPLLELGLILMSSNSDFSAECSIEEKKGRGRGGGEGEKDGEKSQWWGGEENQYIALLFSG
jgi:hypothetical protein